jgi:hypothetical protein
MGSPCGTVRSVLRLIPVVLRSYIFHSIRVAALTGLYLLLAESLDASEILVAIGSALIALVAVEAVSRHRGAKFSFDPDWLRSAIDLPIRIVRDSMLVLASVPAALVRRRRFGELHERGVRHRGEHPGSPAWRAFTVIDISVAPNTFVVRIGERHYRMLIHQLVGSSDD